MSSQPRRPRGAPTGGQRVSQHKNPAQVSLNKDPSWPVVQYERLTWDPSFDLARLDVFERIKAERPYNSAVPPTIADQPVDLAPATAALAEQAAMEIVRFDAQMEALPVTMPAVLLRSESASSSQIEHLTASAKNIAVAEAGLRSTEHAELVTANSRAMMRALELDRPISADSILEIHRRLIEHSEASIAGQWRTMTVWVGSPGSIPHTAEFVPPHHGRIPELIDDLEAFTDRADVAPLVSAAIAHAQFETIHPFADGNGRVGRALVHASLKDRGLTRHATVPVSAGLLHSTASYYDALNDYRAGHIEPIVEQTSHAAVSAAANGRQLAADLIAVRDQWRHNLVARSDSSAWNVLDLAIEHPVLTPAMVAAELDVSERSARSALAAVTDSGALALTTTRKRDRVWHAPAVLRAMDAFADRAGRRSWS